MKKISKRDHTVAAGIVLVKKYSDKYKYLLLRSYSFWDFPKGKKESGESDLETALRETEEEAAVPSDRIYFKWGKDYFETEPYRKKSKIGRYFVAETDFDDIYLPINPELGKPEHHAFNWVTYEEGSKLLNDRLKKVLEWAHNKVKLK